MILKPLRPTWLAAFALGLSIFGLSPSRAENADQAALAAALKNTPATLEQGLKASEKDGTPISAKFEIEDGKLHDGWHRVQGGDRFSG
jgi:hypothetical protein